ncbi:hypothetical protein [Empedobacter brevis]|uniref:hypothetical protein n=1 Tax=Empedobacter brevis TaxID=247 RepID=UPI0039AEB6CF
MYKSENQQMKAPSKVSSINELHRFLGLSKPAHPLISVFNFDEMKLEPETFLSAITTDFYVVALKKDCAGGKFRYGQQYYDFDEGIMYFIAPNQIMQFEDILLNGVKGFVLVMHPDFLQGFPLAKQIKDYGYFSYTTNEALHLSEKEEKSIMHIIENVSKEIDDNMDLQKKDTELLEFHIENEYKSTLGDLYIQTSDDDKIWVKTTYPFTTYEVDSVEELLYILEGLFFNQLFWVISYEDNDWDDTFLMLKDQEIKTEEGFTYKILSWNGKDDKVINA